MGEEGPVDKNIKVTLSVYVLLPLPLRVSVCEEQGILWAVFPPEILEGRAM